MRVRIHRGAHEVGGNCIELEALGARLVLDLGRPLWAEPSMDVPLPAVAGLVQGDDPSLLGLMVSHPHMDHYGLADQAHVSVPVYIGKAAARLLKEAAFFMPGGCLHIIDT
jgi:ribonuclease J